MRITPKSEKELQQQDLLPAGEYDAEVLDAVEKQSKAGNDMIQLKLKVHGEKTITVFDYLMESMGAKLRHAAEAAGVLDRYEAGQIEASDFFGAAVRVKLEIQADKTGQYPDRNGVRDYVVERKAARPESAAAKILNTPQRPKAAPVQAIASDDIPF